MTEDRKFSDDYEYPLTVWADWELVRLIKESSKPLQVRAAKAILQERRESRKTVRRKIRPVEERHSLHL
jgi:hypothetical protein